MTESMNVAIQAIRNFAYFFFNYPAPKEMCESIWGKGVEANHFYNKLKSYDFNMCRFFVELSSSNQEKFAEWVVKNYDCGWNKGLQEELKKRYPPVDTYILFGEMASSRYAEDGIEEVIKHKDEDGYDTREYHFDTEGQKTAYFDGLADNDGWQGYIEITAEDYKKLKDSESSYGVH